MLMTKVALLFNQHEVNKAILHFTNNNKNSIELRNSNMYKI